MADMGRRGGNIGGERRLETRPAEERRKIASNAARKRESKARGDGNTD
jgi:hypothetical protein